MFPKFLTLLGVAPVIVSIGNHRNTSVLLLPILWYAGVPRQATLF